MEVSVGFGENRFTMSRGSFKYRQKLSAKRNLILKNEEKTKNGYILTYIDPKETEPNKAAYRFEVSACGTAACSLAREDTGARADVHCNRKIGPTLDFGCKPEKQVTIFRIGKDGEGNFRFFIAKGEALDKPKQFNRTSVVVKTKTDAKKSYMKVWRQDGNHTLLLFMEMLHRNLKFWQKCII